MSIVEKEKILGYTGKILRIDLTQNEIKEEDLKIEDIDNFIGGIGLATKIICSEVNPNIDPFDPLNILVFMTGPLTGTMVPTTGRYVVAAKSPLTNGWGEAHAGGFFGVKLKRAGYDGIVIKGKANSPVYIYINDDKVEIRDASKYWGMDIFKTDLNLKDELGKEFSIATIGPAGEKLARIACIASDITPDGPRIAGRTGMGAIMGSKNLKAIAVKGTKNILVANAQELRNTLRRILPSIMSSATVQYQALYGTAGEMWVLYKAYGDVPIKNFSLGEWDGVENIIGEAMAKTVFKGHRGCYNCPIKCWKIVETENGLVRAPEYETIASFGTMLLINDPHFLVKANILCNKYGIDTISTGSTIAWAMECYEKGILNKEDLNGLELQWGNKDAIQKLIQLIGERKRIGKILSEGVRVASAIIGKGSEKFALHVKGLEVPMHDPRAFQGMGLQYATSNRGACHLQGFVLRIEQGERVLDLKIYERYNRFDTEGKGRIVALMEDWHQILESMIICKFFPVPPTYVATFYTLVTGKTKKLPELIETGTRIFNLQRMFNIACGISKKDDTLPQRLLEEPLNEGACKGQVVKLEPMLKEYYQYRGWDENGYPTKEILEKLGLLAYSKLLK